MTTSFKVAISAILAFVIAGAIYGAYQYPKAVFGGVGPTNSSNTNGNWASTTWVPSTAVATTTTLINNSGSDRYIISSVASCANNTSSFTAYTGTGLANLIFTAATTSATITGNLASVNANYIMNVPIATTTPWSQVSTSTEGVISGTSRVWPNGVGLTFNSNATTTATCTVGVQYVQS